MKVRMELKNPPLTSNVKNIQTFKWIQEQYSLTFAGNKDNISWKINAFLYEWQHTQQVCYDQRVVKRHSSIGPWMKIVTRTSRQLFPEQIVESTPLSCHERSIKYHSKCFLDDCNGDGLDYYWMGAKPLCKPSMAFYVDVAMRHILNHGTFAIILW